MNKDLILNEIKGLLVRKGVPDKPINEEFVLADGRVVTQLVNHHKKLMKVYDKLPLPILRQEYNILKHQVETAEAEGAKHVNEKSDSE